MAAGDRSLKPAGPREPLSWRDLGFPVDASDPALEGAGDGEVVDPWSGQERALAAIELALSTSDAGFHVYACGLQGPRREREVAELARRFLGGRTVPGDRVLVQNFANPDRPRALYLPAGWGRRLREAMRELVAELRTTLPETFRRETFEEEKERLAEKYGEQGEEINRQLAQRAEQAGFAVQPTPDGQVLFIPLREGRPMTPVEIQALSEVEREDLQRRQRELAREMKAGLRRYQELMRQLAREVKAAERRVAEQVISPMIESVAERLPHPDVRHYLEEVRSHMLDHLAAFREPSPPQPVPPLPFAPAEEEPLLDYEVNVLVDNAGLDAPPVIVEPSPTYKNLFGAVERMVDRTGKLVSNFTRVTGGSLLQAHGGCIVLNVVDALIEPFVWRALKRALKAGRVDIEGYDPFSLFVTSTLKPEPMAIETRVILTGPPEVFQALHFLDEDFREIFRVRAEFGDEAQGEPARRTFVGQVHRIAAQRGLPALTRGAVARLLELAARLVGDRRKLPAQWAELEEVLQEAAFQARRRGGDRIEEGDVAAAVAQRRFRLDRLEAKLRELIRDRALLVDVEGERVGQINGLAVVDIGGYAFGRPSRITAVVSMGNQGLIAVDREAKLSGRTYDKAVFIIAGYLRHLYAQQFPLSLSASISFEQSYTGIEGDSASAAEILALISSLSGIPLRQDLAVTGSVNQFGDVQPVGGVTEKVEGFFRVCREVGLTGRQGVVVPAQNVPNLVLEPEVLEAVRAGRFHIHAVHTIDEALEILTGARAGSVDEEGTVHHLAFRRLRALAEGARRFAAGRKDGGRGRNGE